MVGKKPLTEVTSLIATYEIDKRVAGYFSKIVEQYIFFFDRLPLSSQDQRLLEILEVAKGNSEILASINGNSSKLGEGKFSWQKNKKNK